MTATQPVTSPPAPLREVETLTHPAYCCDVFSGRGFPCAAVAVSVSISRNSATDSLSTCAECPPYTGPEQRTFAVADAVFAQLMQSAALIIAHRICPPPDPECPTPHQERLHRAGLIVRAELERRLDELSTD